MILLRKYSKIALGRTLVERSPRFAAIAIFNNTIFLLLISSQNQIALIAQYLPQGVNFGGNILARINAPELSLLTDTFIDGTPTGRPTNFPSDRVISIIGNSSLQKRARVIVSASIV